LGADRHPLDDDREVGHQVDVLEVGQDVQADGLRLICHVEIHVREGVVEALVFGRFVETRAIGRFADAVVLFHPEPLPRDLRLRGPVRRVPAWRRTKRRNKGWILGVIDEFMVAGGPESAVARQPAIQDHGFARPPASQAVGPREA
jgi:hypothetical protein